jgi:cation transporter-like permease
VEDNPDFAATFLEVFLLFKQTANLLELFLGTSVSSLAQPDLCPTFLAPTAFRELFDPDRDAPPELENLKISSCL